MDRRRFVGWAGFTLAATVASGSAGGAEEHWRTHRAMLKSWASTITPAPARGTARLWWSADAAVGRRAALTFDDGPTEQFTAQVLDILRRSGVPATFFVIGALAERHPDLLRRVRDEGHEIGNHSYDHVSAAAHDHGQVLDAVLRGADVIEKVTGTRPRWFRPPRGEITTATLLAVREAGHDLALWSVVRGDAPDTDSDGVLRHLTGALHPGAIVDLHDGIGRSSFSGRPDGQLLARRRAELAALSPVLPRWLADGYRFGTLSTLIPAAAPPAPAAPDTA